jgi:hypothetical protein
MLVLRLNTHKVRSINGDGYSVNFVKHLEALPQRWPLIPVGVSPNDELIIDLFG